MATTLSAENVESMINETLATPYAANEPVGAPVDDDGVGDGKASTDSNTASNGKQQTTTDTTQKPDGKAKPDGQSSDDKRDQNADAAGQDRGGKPKLRDDGKGNLVDAAGNVVVPAGGERRYYTEAMNARRTVNDLSTKLNTATSQLQAFDKVFGFAKEAGLTTAHIEQGAKLIAAFNRAPQEAIEFLIAQAKANGVEFKLDGEAASRIDTAAIGRMVDGKLAPLVGDRDAQAAAIAARDNAANAINQFAAEFPEALMHETHLAKLIDAASSQGQQLGLTEAWLKLENWMLRNGFDPSKDLDAQLAAAAKGGDGKQNGNGTRQPTVNSDDPPLPNGRGNGAGTQPRNKSTPMSHTASNQDIVRAAMRANGINV
jgi:hypothetical protein